MNISPYLSYVSGALSGCAATVGSYPFDLIRTLLASQGEPKVFCYSFASNNHCYALQFYLLCKKIRNFSKWCYFLNQVYPNMRAAFSDILKRRGFRGLYAGLTPTLIEIVPYAGLQFGTYDTFKRWAMVIYLILLDNLIFC